MRSRHCNNCPQLAFSFSSGCIPDASIQSIPPVEGRPPSKALRKRSGNQERYAQKHRVIFTHRVQIQQQSYRPTLAENGVDNTCLSRWSCEPPFMFRPMLPGCYVYLGRSNSQGRRSKRSRLGCTFRPLSAHAIKQEPRSTFNRMTTFWRSLETVQPALFRPTCL